MTIGELIERLSEHPEYHQVRLSETAPVTGLATRANEGGPFVVIEST